MLSYIASFFLGGLLVFALPKLVGGIECDNYKSAFRLYIIFSIINFLIKKIFALFIIPFQILTLGLGLILVNGLILGFATDLAPGIRVNSLTSIFKGGVILGVFNLVIGHLLP
ncbi:MAG TPA: phage holin family protein [Candidatus Ozemobacteraceae bacterium]|nr:phage holin family protein [Candidatus Ozemobacteraceae bacterium]